MGKVIAIDYGTRRIGLAIGDRQVGVAMPWDVIDGRGSVQADAEAVWGHISDSGEQADAIVLGLPLNMDGSEGEQATLTRAFGAALAEASGVTVDYVDERLSSFAAAKRFETAAKPSAGRRKRKARRSKPLDAVAAAVILESYLQRP